MVNQRETGMDRRSFMKAGMGSLVLFSFPKLFRGDTRPHWLEDSAQDNEIDALVREATLFAGIRKPIKNRSELEPRIAELNKACAGKIAGPLTHIFRFDTPVEGYDSEIGFPVSEEVTEGDVKTHRLRKMHFYSLLHEESIDTLSESSNKLYQYMNTTGLSPELELVEIYDDYTSESSKTQKIIVMAAFLAWPDVYREQLSRVLRKDTAARIWQGGEKMTPHTLVDERCAWVAETINRLKETTSLDQQFDILSRVALVRPIEDVMKYKKMYEETKNVQTIFQAQKKQLEETPTGGFVDPPSFDGKILHVSKVPYNKQKYMEAKTHEEKRRAYCFCNLVRNASNPQIDPIFCYRAAGWARQFWEPILEVEFKRCTITHSILKGDGFCAWDYHLG
jgi:effector-binding domain-containing protein